MKPEVSIILPFRNAGETIRECMNSILAQSYTDWELIAIDDHSTDTSAEIIRGYSHGDSRIKCLNTPGVGIADALNFGVEKANSGIIARMDSDDLMRSTRLEEQLKYLKQKPEVDLVSSEVLQISDMAEEKSIGYGLYVDWTNHLHSHREISDNRFVDSPFAHPSVVFRKTSFTRYGPYRKGEFPEDYEMWLRWLHRGAKMEKINKVLLEWRDSPNRLSRIAREYSKQAFQSVKAKYFSRWLNQHLKEDLSLSAWGTGKIARKQARLLSHFGIMPNRFYEVDPKKIGGFVGNAPIKSIREMGSPDFEFVVGLTGSRGAREKIVTFLENRGFARGVNYILLA